jgi:hypothetical protein
MATGNGQPDCVGYVRAEAPITLGKTYRFTVRFKKSAGLNPQRNLLFQCFGPEAKNGIFTFRRLNNGWIEGDEKIHYPGTGNSFVSSVEQPSELIPSTLCSQFCGTSGVDKINPGGGAKRRTNPDVAQNCKRTMANNNPFNNAYFRITILREAENSLDFRW